MSMPGSVLASDRNPQWTRWVHAMSVDLRKSDGSTRDFDSVDESGALGAFAMRPERLAEVAPRLSVQRFLASPLAQFNALAESTRRYRQMLAAVALPRPAAAPRGRGKITMTLSGALALSHRLGDGALEKWEEARNRGTIALFELANGLF